MVYDSVGKDTFVASLDSLRPRGTMVSYGNASGPVPDFKPLMLAERGSLFLTRPRLNDYIATRKELEENAQDVFQALKTFLKVSKPEVFSLADAAKAHEKLESRGTTGSLVLKF